MKFILLSLLFIFTIGRCFAEQPKIYVTFDNGKINYINKNENVLCKGIPSAGCTLIRGEMRTQYINYFSDGKINEMNLLVSLSQIDVEISSQYKKGSCKFDLVLKHELTHVSLARTIFRTYARELSKALLAVLDSNPYYDAVKFTKITDRFFKQMMQEKANQDAILDAPGSGVYQWEQCENR